MSFYWIVSFTLPECADGNDNKIEISRYLSLYYLAIKTRRAHFLEVIRGERFDTEAKRAGEKIRQRGLLMSLRFQGAIFPHLLGEKTKRNVILGHRASVKRCSVTHFPHTGNGTHSLSMYVIM